MAKIESEKRIGSEVERRNRSGDKVSHWRSKEPSNFKF